MIIRSQWWESDSGQIRWFLTIRIRYFFHHGIIFISDKIFKPESTNSSFDERFSFICLCAIKVGSGSSFFELNRIQGNIFGSIRFLTTVGSKVNFICSLISYGKTFMRKKNTIVLLCAFKIDCLVWWDSSVFNRDSDGLGARARYSVSLGRNSGRQQCYPIGANFALTGFYKFQFYAWTHFFITGG